MRKPGAGHLVETAGGELAAARGGESPRAFWYVAVMLCHFACFYIVNEINALRPPSHMIELRLPADGAIPYLGWTWFIYYGGDIYFVLLAVIVLNRAGTADFRRAVRAYLLMIVGGAALQLIFPAENRWPEALHPVHAWIRNGLNLKPYACLPSMHVALAVLPALLGLSLLRSRAGKAAACLGSLAVTLSTVTLKQHVVLDAATGVIWAILAYIYWLRGIRRGPARPGGVS